MQKRFHLTEILEVRFKKHVTLAAQRTNLFTRTLKERRTEGLPVSQPGCSADQPVAGPRQPIQKLRHEKGQFLVVLQGEIRYSLDTKFLPHRKVVQEKNHQVSPASLPQQKTHSAAILKSHPRSEQSNTKEPCLTIRIESAIVHLELGHKPVEL
eukprot:1145741-Pelagomonas_calceolata.AAC.1